LTARIGWRSVARVVAAAIVAVVFVSPATAQPESVRTVLTIHWSTEEFPSTPVLDAAIRDTLRSLDTPVDYFAEYLESDRFPPEEAVESLRDYIQRKYRDRHIDVVIAVADPALEFALRYRSVLFPDAPIVASVGAVPDAAIRTAGRGVTGLVPNIGYDQTLALALQLHPSTERVFVVARAPTISYARLMESLQPVAGGVPLSLLDETSVERLLEEVRAIPERSLVLYIRHSREDRGKVLFPSEIAQLVSEASPVPVYGITDAMIGTGVVGGIVTVRERIGRRLADMVQTILAGTPAQDIPFARGNLVPMFDWRQIERWSINPALLPPQSVIRFRVPTTWELYRWYVVGSVTLVLAQSALIAGLLAQRKKRRRVEAALRESEAHFRTMADTAPVMIWRSGSDKKCDFFNLPWLTFTGRTLAEELGDGWAQGVHPDDLAFCLKTYTTAFDARETFQMEYRLRRFDGEYRWVFDVGVPRWESDGVFAGYIGSCLDISDRKQAEQSLDETHRELSRVSRLTALGEFAASIAHEVRQPLTAIILNARACLRGMSSATPDLEDIKAGLLDVVTASQRAEQVIQRNRELFRLHTVQTASLDLNGVIRDAVLLSGNRLTENGVTVHMRLADELVTVSGDRIELQQVLLNLLGNAIDAMEGVEEGARRLQISSVLVGDQSVKVTVADNGVGLAGVDMRQLFTLSYTTKPAGTGVGLSISRSIVEAHGGQLWAEPNPERGATFCFSLPIAAPLPADPHNRKPDSLDAPPLGDVDSVATHEAR
jgi:PAS domain S-box-containing protein